MKYFDHLIIGMGL